MGLAADGWWRDAPPVVAVRALALKAKLLEREYKSCADQQRERRENHGRRNTACGAAPSISAEESQIAPSGHVVNPLAFSEVGLRHSVDLEDRASAEPAPSEGCNGASGSTKRRNKRGSGMWAVMESVMGAVGDTEGTVKDECREYTKSHTQALTGKSETDLEIRKRWLRRQAGAAPDPL